LDCKAVDSKCRLCTDLQFLRSVAKSKAQRQELSHLSVWHRMTFMGERQAYYERIRKATNGEGCLSMISDGMQQVRRQVLHLWLPHVLTSLASCRNTTSSRTWRIPAAIRRSTRLCKPS
jgi:hypothetical protein